MVELVKNMAGSVRLDRQSSTIFDSINPVMGGFLTTSVRGSLGDVATIKPVYDNMHLKPALNHRNWFVKFHTNCIKSVKIKTKSMSEKPLYWDASYEIVLTLMEVHPDIELSEIGLEELNKLIVKLPNFADDPALVNDGILNDILREWYEESTQ